jgi:hypothetical protein
MIYEEAEKAEKAENAEKAERASSSRPSEILHVDPAAGTNTKKALLGNSLALGVHLLVGRGGSVEPAASDEAGCELWGGGE